MNVLSRHRYIHTPLLLSTVINVDSFVKSITFKQVIIAISLNTRRLEKRII